MADTKKQLVLVVEGTPTMRLYWSTVLYEYLDKIIKSFCGNDDTIAANHKFELGLVVFKANESSIYELSKRYGLTSEMKVLFDSLSFINFDSGNSRFNSTIADGLNAAATLFDTTNVKTNWHCILVAASNPDQPAYEQLKTVAKSFSEFGISLSVICPEKYPILKEIYNAGKGNASATDHTIDIDEYPNYLVLISEKLVKDCADLSQSEIIPVLQNPPEAQGPVNWKPVADHVQGPSSQTSEHVPLGNTKSVLKTLCSQVRQDIPTGISTIAGIMSVGEYSYGNNEARQSIPETGTTMSIPPPRPPLPVMSYAQVQLQSPGVIIWEGDLAYLNNGWPVLMARLKAYKIWPSSNVIAADWPRTMVIERFIIKADRGPVNNAYILLFRATDHLALHSYLQQTNSCAFIRLPREVLVLAPVLLHPNEFTGMLFPWDGLKIIPQIPKHHQPPSQPQQQGRFLL